MAASEETGSVSFLEKADSNSTQLYFRLKLTDAEGKALPQQEVIVELEGDGSLAHNFSSKEIHRETDHEGTNLVTWYRRSIWGRDVKGRLVARPAAGEGNVSWEQVEDVDLGPKMSWMPFRIQVPKRSS